MPTNRRDPAGLYKINPDKTVTFTDREKEVLDLAVEGMELREFDDSDAEEYVGDKLNLNPSEAGFILALYQASIEGQTKDLLEKLPLLRQQSVGKKVTPLYSSGISIIAHEVEVGVRSGSWHTAIMIVPTDQQKYANDPRFLTNSKGQRYLTIGAGPSWGAEIPCVAAELNSTRLKGGEDDPARHDNYYQKIYELDQSKEDATIAALLANYESYRKNETSFKYVLYPEYYPGYYNSNSFVVTLLASVRLQSNLPHWKFPGVLSPLPVGAFNPQPP